MDVTIGLKCIYKKRGRYDLLITDENQAWFTKVST